MPAGEAKEKNMIKSRMIILAQMFYEHTDQDHPMTGLEILEYLKEHDVPANEKTLRGDIKLLQELGLDIVKIVSRPNYFFWGERQHRQLVKQKVPQTHMSMKRPMPFS